MSTEASQPEPDLPKPPGPLVFNRQFPGPAVRRTPLSNTSVSVPVATAIALSAAKRAATTAAQNSTAAAPPAMHIHPVSLPLGRTLYVHRTPVSATPIAPASSQPLPITTATTTIVLPRAIAPPVIIAAAAPPIQPHSHTSNAGEHTAASAPPPVTPAVPSMPAPPQPTATPAVSSNAVRQSTSISHPSGARQESVHGIEVRPDVQEAAVPAAPAQAVARAEDGTPATNGAPATHGIPCTAVAEAAAVEAVALAEQAALQVIKAEGEDAAAVQQSPSDMEIVAVPLEYVDMVELVHQAARSFEPMPAIYMRRPRGLCDIQQELNVRVPEWPIIWRHKEMRMQADHPMDSDHYYSRTGSGRRYMSRQAVQKVSKVTRVKGQNPGRTYTSKYRGVHQTFPTKRWEAQFRRNGKPTSLGCFDQEEEAARAYDRMMLWCELHHSSGVKGGITNFDPTEYQQEITWLQGDDLVEELRSKGRKQAAKHKLRLKREGQESGYPSTSSS